MGLRANWRQFTLLVVVSAFVGAMVGLERAVLPLLAEDEFGLASRAAILYFIATFGLAKALSNVLAGHLGDRYGRKLVLVAGWVVGMIGGLTFLSGGAAALVMSETLSGEPRGGGRTEALSLSPAVNTPADKRIPK